ncbi:MAG: hypothetical protein AAF696_07870 [Bacteroidota bacterium]
MNDYLDISQLKGITILYPDDFYEYARVVIKIMDAHGDFQRKQGKNVGIARPTIYGLARKFAATADLYFSEEYVLNILKKQGFSTREALVINDLNK